MFVFIDTNILLSFYHFASDDLDELQKLLDSIKHGVIVLALPDQVRQEFWRNRETKIADALDRLRDQKLNLQFPQICKDSSLYPAMRAAQKDYERNHSQLVAELTKAANLRQLKADQVIGELFRVGTAYQTGETIIAGAQLRVSLGNPPGKNGSLGDAVNWEALLDKVPNGEDLYFISDDKDFRSAIDDTQFSDFLSREWTVKKESRLRYYNRLSAFFTDYYPNIELAREKEIETLITELATSGSFAYTHTVVAKFEQYTEFTNDQVNQIVAAMVSNNQVAWIINDEDVSQFAKRVIKDKEGVIDKAILNQLHDLLSNVEQVESSPINGEELPF